MKCRSNRRSFFSCSATVTKTVTLVASFLLLILIAAIEVVQAQEAEEIFYDCDYSAIPETCVIMEWLFDDICDSYNGDETDNPCWQTDCYDCDPCKELGTDCEACLASGCFFCPGNALCLSSPVGDEFWNLEMKVSSCIAADDWLTGDSAACAASTTDNLFNDPNYSAQKWVYDLMNVEPVWRQGITGKGVIVRVNDPDGVDPTIEELWGRFDESASCPTYLPPEIPPGENTTVEHGTVVATIALGWADNGVCAAGIAHGATLSACLGPLAAQDEDVARFLLDGLETTDISINSWGFDACDYSSEATGKRNLQENCPFVSDYAGTLCELCPNLDDPECQARLIDYCKLYYGQEQIGCSEYLDLFISCQYNVLSEVGRSAITRGITEGRNGKGSIYVFAAGNEYDKAEDVNMEGWLNTRFTLLVGAVGKNGYHSSYSTPGAALFVAGPGGDFEYVSNHIAAQPDNLCKDNGVGTSFATPAVAGVIALMLEANPELSWRDVYGVLATTSQKVYPDDPSWITNAVGLHHSDKFGFGLVDAEAAVKASQSFALYGPEKQVRLDSGPLNEVVPEFGPLEDLLPFELSLNDADVLNATGDAFMAAEHVVVYLELDHSSRGDLEIILTSPAGTESLLIPGNRVENTISLEQWKLLTVRSWNENPIGTWKLSVIDTRAAPVDDCLDIPWEYVDYENEFYVSCGDFEFVNSTDCGGDFAKEFPSANPDVNGLTMTDACCYCGGGASPTSIPNTLVRWQLVVYGRGVDSPILAGASPFGNSTSNSTNVVEEEPEEEEPLTMSNATDIPVEETIAPSATSDATSRRRWLSSYFWIAVITVTLLAAYA